MIFSYPYTSYPNQCYCWTLAKTITKILGFNVRGYTIDYKTSEGLKIRLNPELGTYMINDKIKEIQLLMESTGLYTVTEQEGVYVTVPDNMRDTVLLLLELRKK